ncbi:hypothetical protein BDV10DRAFT_125390 [Aspergillus recurvatus]
MGTIYHYKSNSNSHWTRLSSSTHWDATGLHLGTDCGYRPRRIGHTRNGWHSPWTTGYIGHVSEYLHCAGAGWPRRGQIAMAGPVPGCQQFRSRLALSGAVFHIRISITHSLNELYSLVGPGVAIYIEPAILRILHDLTKRLGIHSEIDARGAPAFILLHR